NLGDNRVTSMGFDMSKVKCYNCHRKGHFARECRYPKDSRRSGATEPQRRTAPGDCETLSPSSPSDRLQPSGGYHTVPPPITGTFMPPKPDLVFHTAPIDVETDHSAFTVKLSPSKPTQDLSHTNRPAAPIIEDWVSDSEDESETNDPQSVPSFVQSFERVKAPRHSVQPIEAPILDATLKLTSPKFNSISKRRNRKTCFVCKSKFKSPIRQHITRSKSPKTSSSPPRVNAAQVPVSNDVTRLQALVDRKKVVITEAVIRDVLRLDDAEGSMSAKRTSWNEFSSAMASAVIYLSTGDAKEQVQGNDNDAAQGADTAVSGDDVQDQSIPSHTPPTPPPQQPQDITSTSQEALDACAALTRRVEHLKHDKVAQALEITMLKKRVKKLEKANKERMIADLDRDEGIALMDDEGAEKKAKDAQVAGDEQVKGRQAEIYQIDMDHASKVLSMQEDEPEVQEAVEVVTTAKLITEVVAPVSESVSAASATIAAVPAATITSSPVRVAAASTRRKKGVVIRDSEEESIAKTPAETKSKDKDKGIMVEEPKPMKKKQHVEMDEEYARKLHEELNKDIDWSVAIDHKAAKRRKLNEEVEDLKQHLEIVPDEDDDVYTKATPLAKKVPVVDYEIVHFNNKPQYKIIRADGTHQLPDGQAQVWKNQRTVHGQARVKSWKLLKSCGVHIITFTTTQLILLVERRYPLSRFTLDQMLNAVRLRVEEQSEMSLELIRFTRQQLQEGQHE
nr:hypothetical protein [Tanacetum cinerariifolium]